MFLLPPQTLIVQQQELLMVTIGLTLVCQAEQNGRHPMLWLIVLLHTEITLLGAK